MREQLSKQRASFIDEYREKLLSKLETLQNALYLEVLAEFVDKLEVSDNKIVNTGKNYALVRSLSRVNSSFAESKLFEFGVWFTKSLVKLIGLNLDYFDHVSPTAQDFEGKAIKQLFDRIGYDGKKFVKNGFMYDLLKNDDVIRKIKAQALQAISAGKNYTDFKKDFRIFIKGGDKQGVLKSHVRTAIYDTYQQQDRLTGQLLADELKLNYAVYAGGLMDTSRPFCKARNSKVYNRKEIAKWKSLNFQGKPDNYNPFIDLGGHNCTHQLDWISDELAEQLRPV